jgi:hypothetical protein
VERGLTVIIELTLDLLVCAFLAVAGINKVTQGIVHVEATDEVIQGGRVGENAGLDVGAGEASDVGIHSDDQLQVVGGVGDGGFEILFDGLPQEGGGPHATVESLLHKLILELGEVSAK